ncbi:MAG: hypothetical protein L3K23_04855 [Thermoplasmata archaeon]|nr:hypothetical protein [Thermoplasmata archaeon]
MAAPSTVTARCPACGGLLAAIGTPYAATYVRCPHCGGTVPIVAPRDPPPLFAWEVSPQLYPPIPSISEGGRRSVRPFVLGALVLATVITAALAGFTAAEASNALAPGHLDLAGVLVGESAGLPPHPFAHLIVSGENGYRAAGTDAPDGSFDFPGVPLGAVTLLVNATGYPNTSFEMFFSSILSQPSRSTGLQLDLSSGGTSNALTVLYTPWGSLEEFVATLLTATVIFAVGVLVACVGVWAVVRHRRPSFAVAGAAAMIVAPATLPLLTLDTVLPDALLVSSVAGALGAAAFVLLVVPIALTASAPEE